MNQRHTIDARYLVETVKNLYVAVSLNTETKRKKRMITLIKQRVCQKYGISLKDLMRLTRKEPIPDARFMVWRLARELDYRITLDKLGEMFGKDHSTVIHGIQAIQEKIDTEDETRRIYESIINSLK